MQVAKLSKAYRHGGDREVRGLGIGDLVPADRRRDDAGWRPADRVGTRDRVITSVLVVVDEDRAVIAVLAPPGEVDHAVAAALHLSSEGPGCASYIGEAMSRWNPDVDVQPLPTGGLRIAHRPQFGQHLLSNHRHSPDIGVGRQWHGI